MLYQARALRQGRAAVPAGAGDPEKALGPEHPDVATSLNNLAALYQATGRYAEAEPLYQRALAILEEVLGPDHPNTKTARANLETLKNASTKEGAVVQQ